MQAFTNALQTSLPAVESELRRYLARGQFVPIQFTFPENVAGGKIFITRNLTPVELLRIDRLDDAETIFTAAKKLAPASPLPYEGLGLLAVRREQTDETLREFKEALQRGSGSFLAHYLYAREKFQLAASQGRRGSLPAESAAEIHAELLKSIVLMPNFGPSHELFGILEMARGENLTLAVQHLQLAVQLEPENPYFLLALADAQARNNDPQAARRTLTVLFLPTVEAKLRAQAEELLQQITGSK